MQRAPSSGCLLAMAVCTAGQGKVLLFVCLILCLLHLFCASAAASSSSPNSFLRRFEGFPPATRVAGHPFCCYFGGGLLGFSGTFKLHQATLPDSSDSAFEKNRKRGSKMF